MDYSPHGSTIADGSVDPGLGGPGLDSVRALAVDGGGALLAVESRDVDRVGERLDVRLRVSPVFV